MSNWIFSQLSPTAPGLWLTLSLLHGVTVLIALRSSAVQLLTPRAVAWLWRMRWLLFAYLGLISGGVSPRLMGLSDIDWVRGLTLGATLIAGLTLLLALTRLTILPTARQENPAVLPTNDGAWLSWLWLGMEQFHWTFLRAAVWEMLLTLPTPPALPAYHALWIGTLLAAPEALLMRQGMVDRLARAVALITTTLVFFYTRNFWLCWLMHAVTWSLLGTLRARPAKHEPLRAGMVEGK